MVVVRAGKDSISTALSFSVKPLVVIALSVNLPINATQSAHSPCKLIASSTALARQSRLPALPSAVSPPPTNARLLPSAPRLSAAHPSRDQTAPPALQSPVPAIGAPPSHRAWSACPRRTESPAWLPPPRAYDETPRRKTQTLSRPRIRAGALNAPPLPTYTKVYVPAGGRRNSGAFALPYKTHPQTTRSRLPRNRAA
ncbi:hypothetical protein C8R43DRAFT_1119920 [Mycena crocata]|nr:hypothetical protein C8R43DRAFT_1119920 [Mycena crocata]